MFINKVLDENRLKVLDLIKPFLKEYPICGGTGLALHLGHRISFDFDLFSPKPLPKFLDQKIATLFKDINVIRNTQDELTFFTASNVKVTFLYYPFKSLEPDIEYKNLYIGSLNDLIANKFYVIGRRAEIRDYIDIYTILQTRSLEECIKLSKQKYGELISIKTILGQLKYIDDLNFQDPVFIQSSLTPEILSEYLSETAEKFIKDNKKI